MLHRRCFQAGPCKPFLVSQKTRKATLLGRSAGLSRWYDVNLQRQCTSLTQQSPLGSGTGKPVLSVRSTGDSPDAAAARVSSDLGAEDVDHQPSLAAQELSAQHGGAENSSESHLSQPEELEEGRAAMTENLSASTSGRNPSVMSQAAAYIKAALAMLQKSWRRSVKAIVSVLGWVPWLAREMQLKQLRNELKKDPQPERYAALAKALNNAKQPVEVIRLWEEAEQPGVVTDAFATEYLKGLVFTNRINDFAAPEAMQRGQPRLADLLRHCQQRLGTEEGQPPGDSSLRPLHVTLQGAGMMQSQKGGSVWWSLWRTVTTFLIMPALFLFCLIAGWVAMKGGLPSTQTGSNAAGTSLPVTPPASTTFAPKEYNKEAIPEKSVKTFADVRGCDEAKNEVSEIVEFLKDPGRFTRLGGKLPKGVLLTGPPGTGKTLLAKAIAGEAGVPFFFRAGSEFDEMLVGVGSLRVRTLFQAAKKAAPCIVFIDEIDAIGQARNSSLESGSAKTLNQLLVEMDGFEANEGVVVIAATNLDQKLDAALKRPGRFDREVAVPLPDVRGRLDIIQYYLKDKPLTEDVNAEVMARRTPGFSGADLSNMINEAALSAAKTNQDAISSAIIDEARDKILMGSPRASMVQSQEARRLTAYHEAGHALVALNTPGATPIHKATIVPRGHALGMVSMLPLKDEYSVTRQQLRAGIDVSMGGRVAEELIFGDDQVTSGATSDLKHATKQARHMIMECGMSSEIGPVYISDEKSAETRRVIDSEITKMLREAHKRVTDMLTAKKGDLDKLAKALLDHETLTAREIEQVLKDTLQKTPVAPRVDPKVEGDLLAQGIPHSEPV